MDKLFFVEGLPGTGKTTITEWLTKSLVEKGVKVTCLLEGDMQIPTNFFHIASIPEGIKAMGITDHFQNRYSIETGIARSHTFPCVECRVKDTDWSEAKEVICKLIPL